MPSSILDLPTETLVDIFLIVVLSADGPEACGSARNSKESEPGILDSGNGLAGYITASPTDPSCDSSIQSNTIYSVYSLGLVCKRFYSVIYHPAQDVRIWKVIAISLGYDQSLVLGNILKCATSSALPKASWRKAAYIAAMWNKPFKHGVRAAGWRRAKTVKAVSKSLLPPSKKGVTRTFDLALPGQGRSGPTYVTVEPSSKDGGKLFAQLIHSTEQNPRSVSTMWASASPKMSSGKVIFRGADQDISTMDFSLPNQSNLVMEECTLLADEGDVALGYEIARYSPSSGKKDRIWRLPDPPPERYVANGDLLLALYSPNMVFFWTGAPDNPARLQCYQAVSPLHLASTSRSITSSSYSSSASISGLNVTPTKSSSAQSLSFATSRSGAFAACHNGRSEMLWDINLSRDWSNDSPRDQFCVVRNMKMTSRYVVVLVHWYPTSSMHKLSGTSFRILHLGTGETKTVLKFNQPDFSRPYPMFTTVSDHDFVVTDTHIVSGGPYGELYVWNYHMQNTPLYTIPEPQTERPTRAVGSFAPMYNNLTVSIDGKYLVAAANNRITVWNMFSKRLEGVYHNGRKVIKRDLYLRNPFDNFRTGIWILYRDWRQKTRRATSLERLVSDDTFVEEYELVSEKFKYITELFGKDEIETGFTEKRGFISRHIMSTDLMILFEALGFWIHWLLITVWAYSCFLLAGGEKMYSVAEDSDDVGGNAASIIHNGNTGVGEENDRNDDIHQN
ncbi:hypothetical protein V1525DRAFT_397447 [Lipomyces kononenkoae]|uniref:Uncharacterized protein n=1 Tax=Lipomyces kononenkoae TaxID=34357 RepID=A0ACC3T723_LIPKO